MQTTVTWRVTARTSKGDSYDSNFTDESVAKEITAHLLTKPNFTNVKLYRLITISEVVSETVGMQDT